MTPDGAVAMMKEMPDDEVIRLLYSLKPDISGAILDAMSKPGGASAKRAAGARRADQGHPATPPPTT